MSMRRSAPPGRRDGSRRRCADAAAKLCRECARWSSPTCTPRPSAPRWARSCATRSRRCAAATTSRSSCSPSRPSGYAARRPRAAPALPRQPLRRRPRALRPDRLAGGARPARARRRDAARQRPLPPALEASSPARAAVRRPHRRGEPRVQRQRPRRPAASRSLPVGIDTTRFRPIPRARGARAPRPRPRRAVPALPPRPEPAAEGVPARAGGGGRDAAADAWATSRPTRSRTGSTPPTRCSSRRSTRASASR